jgi:hypothetical protein
MRRFGSIIFAVSSCGFVYTIVDKTPWCAAVSADGVSLIFTLAFRFATLTTLLVGLAAWLFLSLAFAVAFFVCHGVS